MNDLLQMQCQTTKSTHTLLQLLKYIIHTQINRHTRATPACLTELEITADTRASYITDLDCGHDPEDGVTSHQMTAGLISPESTDLLVKARVK